MTRLFNDPTAFADEMAEGFALAHADRVLRVPGGVVAARRRPEDVAVIIGGGSGHYPAFAGYVGPGLAAGAALGNLFASPSAQQVASVGTAAHGDAGLLFSYGNYAGDVLNFDLAQDRLREQGVRCETVVVTDDIASAPAGQEHRRRGIAGDLVVFKVAGAAAAEGHDLATVATLARRANDRTRSLGVAFTGCTLPGADEPLFTVPEGRMSIGLGIHGEPGLEETDVPTADELGSLLVSRIVAEAPEDAGTRVGVTLNGLGSVKYEELFVIYRAVASALESAGLETVAPQVGEYCTSFDMAGVSLTLVWLDDELERLYLAPCDSPALRIGVVADAGEQVVNVSDAPLATTIEKGSPASAAVAVGMAEGLTAVAGALDASADELGRIDAVAGDGDHGIGMRRGGRAAAEAARTAADAGAGVATTLRAAADAWSDCAGGTSGVLWGLLLDAAGRELGDHDAPTTQSIAAAAAAGVAAVRERGGAAPGDKTMIDALQPFADTLLERSAAGGGLADSWRSAAAAASEGADATAQLSARRGRARTHGDKSIGTPDAGAVSAALVARTIADLLS